MIQATKHINEISVSEQELSIISKFYNARQTGGNKRKLLGQTVVDLVGVSVKSFGAGDNEKFVSHRQQTREIASSLHRRQTRPLVEAPVETFGGTCRNAGNAENVFAMNAI